MRISHRLIAYGFAAGLIGISPLVWQTGAAAGDEPVTRAVAQLELPILQSNDFRSTQEKRYLAKAGSTLPFQSAGSPVGSILLDWSFMPWEPPPAPKDSPQPPQRDPGASLVITLSYRQGATKPVVSHDLPIDITIQGPSPWEPDVEISISQGSVAQRNYTTRHGASLPPERLGGEWRVRWNHGLIAVERRAKRSWRSTCPARLLPRAQFRWR